MIHGFVEITHHPVDKETCDGYIEKLIHEFGEEPFGANLAVKYATETKFVVMCYFSSHEGLEYAKTLASSFGPDHGSSTIVVQNAREQYSWFDSGFGPGCVTSPDDTKDSIRPPDHAYLEVKQRHTISKDKG